MNFPQSSARCRLPSLATPGTNAAARKTSRPVVFARIAVLVFLHCSAAGAAAGAATQAQAPALRLEKLMEMETAINGAITKGQCPGAVLWLEHGGEIFHRALGKRALVPAAETMTRDTIFDVASLTKVVAGTPAVMLLVERGVVKLDEPVATHIPEFTGEGREKITVRQLLAHTSGMRPGIDSKADWQGAAAAIKKACQETPRTAPGTAFVYSDINFLLLGEIVRRASGMPLNEFVAREIYAPLKMTDTGFLPPHDKLPRIAPTEVVDGKPWRGTVHDPTARKMGGVSGNAGLFSTAADLARYARMLLNEGELDGARVFKPETVRLMTGVQSPAGLPPRGLGWDISSRLSSPRGGIFPFGSFGHTGFTGTAMWIDPFSRTFFIFLSNRVHPSREAGVVPLYGRLGTLAAEAVGDFDFAGVAGAPKARVLNGIDVLVKNNFAPLKGKRIGLITNHTGHDRERNSTIDLLKNAPDVTLVALFSPEHGIRGEADEKVADSRDAKTGLPIHSLYGKNRKPQPGQLAGLDALVYDIQDIGCRFYTYASTMGLAIEAAAENGREIFVLDRVNPINGVTVEGPVLAEPPTFVGFFHVPLRHGMTVGELAKMYNAEKKLGAKLTVIPMENWWRGLWLDQTGLPWSNPSPNIRNLKQAALYPGIGLLESAMSVGRGTDTPFEQVGAPYINEVDLAERLNSEGLPGVRFVPIRFTPAQSTHKGKNCGGVYVMLTDLREYDSVDIGILIAKTLCQAYPKQFDADKIQRLLLHKPVLDAIKAGKSLGEIRALWKGGREEFLKRREEFLIYQ